MTQQTAKTRSETGQADFQFGGFKNLNSTPIPDEFFDLLAVKLSEAELRVLLYIMRRTFGFKKTGDAISLSQLTEGIRRRDGSVLDYGTGLSRPSVLKAVSGLRDKGIITVEKRTGYDGRNEVNVYQLRFQTESAGNSAERDFPENRRYSEFEYSKHTQTNFPHPDPQFVSAQPVAHPRRVEQRRSGETNRQGKETSSHPAGVKPLYQEGKATLPPAKSATGRGKAGLPGGLSQRHYQGKNGEEEGVKMVNQQESSLQNFSRQKTAQQVVLRAQGALALQEMAETEAVEVEVDGDQLYISFRKLVLALMELGLSEKLANEVGYAYPEAYLWEKIELTRQQVNRSSHQRTLRNVAGYLRRAIEEDYQPRKESSEGSSRESRGNKRQFPQAEALFGKDRSAAQFSTSSGSGFSNNEANRATPQYPGDAADQAFQEEFITYPKEDTAPLPPIYRPDSQRPATGGIGRHVTPISYCGEPEEAGGSSGGAEARLGPHIPTRAYRELRGWPDEEVLQADAWPYESRQAGEYERAGDWYRDGGEPQLNGQRAAPGGQGPGQALGRQSGFERVYGELWEQVGEDLAGRFRLGDEMALLEGSWLWLEAGDDNRAAEAVVMVKAPWQLRELGPVVRNAVSMGLRQRVGPGYRVRFELA